MRTSCRTAALLLSLGLVSACQLAHPFGDPAGPSDSPDPAGSEAPADGPRTIPPQLLECGESEGEEALQLAELDLTSARWSTPDGFAETTAYHEDNPVEEVYSTWYAEPTDPLPSLNVIQVVIYQGLDWGGLADDCGRVPLEAVTDQLARYREQIGAEPLDDAQMTEVAGHPAITQRIALERYQYLGYWLFSEDQLLHAYCQWTDDAARTVIESACAPLVASIAVQ